MPTYSWVLDDQDKVANKAVADAPGDNPRV